jgi:squalene synthase HpnC
MAWDFGRELAMWGPESPRTAVRGLSFARAYCKHVTTSHYENFTVASLFLPRRLIRHFHAVYAYCRWSDDIADETAGGAETLALLDWWRGELLACYPDWRAAGFLPAGKEDGRDKPGRSPGNSPRHPVMLALRETIRRFDIPPEPFLNLLIAFAQDQHIKRYPTFDQLLGYCRNSANPVGRLVLYLFDCFDPRRAALADEVCTGLQLANFWQDVARDFAIGRVYLPEDDRLRFGYSDVDLAAGRCTPAFRELMRFEVERARGYFDRGAALLPLLPRAARLDVDLFIRGGRAILKAIERLDFEVWTRRPEVSKFEKVKLLVGAVMRGGLGE